MRRQSLLSWDSLPVVFALLNVWMIQSSVSAYLPSQGILGSCSSSTSVRTTLRRMMQRDEFVRQIWTATAFAGMLSNVVPASAQPLSHPQSGKFCVCIGGDSILVQVLVTNQVLIIYIGEWISFNIIFFDCPCGSEYQGIGHVAP